MRVEPLARDHFDRLLIQPAQAAWDGKADLVNGIGALLAERSWAATDAGEVLGVAGLLDHGEGRALAWALLSENAGRAMLGLTRVISRYLEVAPFRRIEAKVVTTFEPGRRWVKMLGFQFEGVASAYCEDGTDAETWALVKRT